MTLLGMTSTAFLLVLFVYFILASGDLFKRKIVGLAGLSLAQRWETARAINDVNRSMPGYVVRRVQLGLNDRGQAVKGARVLVLGIAYKKNTNDARETPAAAVVRVLRRGATPVSGEPMRG